MQRALGIDMTTPRSKSQQQIHSPSHQAKPISDPYSQRGPSAQGGPNQPRIPHPGAVPLPGLTKAPSQPDLGRGSPMHQQVPRQPDHTRSAGSSPAHRLQSQPLPQAQDGLTKLFGFGASLLNQASTLINVDPLPTQSTQPSPAKGKVMFSNAGPDTRGQQQQQQGPKPFGMGGLQTGPSGGPHAHMGGPEAPPTSQPQKPVSVAAPVVKETPAPPPPEPEKPKVNCPLCKTELNIGSSDPPNYNSCTQCHSQVCNLCGFNPTPHLVEKKEWLCLNCQTLRLMSGGGLDEPPMPAPLPSPKHQPMGSPRHHPPSGPPSAQQSPLHKPPTTQAQGAKPGQKLPTAAKPASETKTGTTITTTTTPEAPKPIKTEEKPKTEPEKEKDKESKKKEPITPIKEVKKSKHYDVSLTLHFCFGSAYFRPCTQLLPRYLSKICFVPVKICCISSSCSK
uniref:Zinc finger piccolo-type domain-containing protein n=1 Tax=Periophthalmus magnuspinnatus TaxID=409849 RepID=A0A3B3Z812_9GOBI